MGRIRKFAVEMTRRVNRGESQTGPSPALGNPHQTPVPTFPQRWRRRAAWQRQSPTPLKSGPLTDSCTEPFFQPQSLVKLLVSVALLSVPLEAAAAENSPIRFENRQKQS